MCFYTRFCAVLKHCISWIDLNLNFVLDSGKGFVILCNGDNPGVLLQCEVARYLLGPNGTLVSMQLPLNCFMLCVRTGLDLDGIAFSDWYCSVGSPIDGVQSLSGGIVLDMTKYSQETIVNQGILNSCAAIL